VFRFTDLVRGSETVRDVKQKDCKTEPVFERLRLRPSCCDCSIEQAARKVGASVNDLLLELNEVTHRTASLAA